jgi:phenylpyruvate tautomerase PptA (4-oxalocrotonate tautomerase family)
MPSSLISVRKPLLPAARVALIETVQTALVETLHIPAHDRCLRLQVFEPDDFVVQQEMTENFTLIEVSLFPGRSLEAKRAFYKAVVAGLGELGIAPADVRVILNEVARENWGLRGGVAGCDLELGFKVEV